MSPVSERTLSTELLDMDSSKLLTMILEKLRQQETRMSSDKKDLEQLLASSYAMLCDKIDAQNACVEKLLSVGHHCSTPSTEVVVDEQVVGQSSVQEAARIPSRFQDKSVRTYGAGRFVSELNEKVVEPKLGLAERLRSFVASPAFDLASGSVVIANVICVGLHTQLQGQSLGLSLGVSTEGGPQWDVDGTFLKVEAVFIAVYWMELLLRVWAMQAGFFRSLSMMYELIIVLICTVDVATGLASMDLGIASLGPLLRMTRVLKVAKVVRLMSTFSELNIILTTLRNSVVSLGWSMVLLLVVTFSSNLFVCQVLRASIVDESMDSVLRIWAFERFGTTARGMLTMFEVTFSTKWLDILRTLTMEFSVWHAVFWAIYVVVINFATIRILGAMFIKQAMAASHSEDERIAVARMKELKTNAAKFYNMFKEVDVSGDGKIDQKELEEFLTRDGIEKHEFFNQVDLSEEEFVAIFELVSAETGEVDFEEFLGIALTLKNPVRNIDNIQIMRDQLLLRRQVDGLDCKIGKLLRHLQGQCVSTRDGVPAALEV